MEIPTSCCCPTPEVKVAFKEINQEDNGTPSHINYTNSSLLLVTSQRKSWVSASESRTLIWSWSLVGC